MTELSIPETEHRRRTRDLLERADADGYDGLVLFGALNIHYASGMYHLPTERPVALGITDERIEAVVPRLEREHAERGEFLIDEVTTYFEYPQGDPMERVAEMCERLGLADGSIAVDSDGSPARNGYTGPALSELVDAEVGLEAYVTEMRETKSDAEIDLIREASVWANFGHRLLQERIEPGRRPIEVRAEVEAEAVKPMLDALGDRYEMRSWANPMQCLFTTGDVTELPHSMDQTTRIERGDNIVTIVKPTVGGYTTELERTMFVGEVSDEKREYFEIMTESQEIAIDAIGPGVEYAAVEEAVVDYYEEQGVAEYTQHHVGHNIGMEGHERPFLDVDQEGEIRPGELFTVEPGFYVPDVGGFRHSDTVVVTEDGTETLTDYPRDLESLIV
ncbi:peptidase M24 [Halobiforma lacisalsi AJ5]|uniref:Peptidase M24 n=1 Tax=Natronobacterium lacisalsi AJ5 TaxID=358396 RepID=M0LUJ7_NATLA|nr:Xaa-Pro peptidase family protein [Halobiforma lacisalsi]APW99793.1 peptidase M24 [Halobiforma lacisalsi AJ5]EMA36029.1 peptidase M24 [Halobiforma lacisalsi AJ5]